MIQAIINNIEITTPPLETVIALLSIIPGLPFIFFINWVRKNPIKIDISGIRYYNYSNHKQRIYEMYGLELI